MTILDDTALSAIAGETSSSITQTMICGNCLSVLQSMPAASVKASAFSPPDNLRKPYNVYDDNLPDPVHLAFMGDVARELRRVTKPDGHVFLNMGWNTKHPWRSIDVLLAYRPFFELQNAIAWIKSLAIDGSRQRSQPQAE